MNIENPPRQIEFAKLYLTNVVTGKRYIKKLVEDQGIVDGWDDPRLVSIAALRRRGLYPGIHQDVYGDGGCIQESAALLTMQCLTTVSVKI